MMESELKIWILTFDRPAVLNRLVYKLGLQGYKSCIFSNHPEVKLDQRNAPYVERVLINSLNTAESNSWCCRSWNSMLIQAFNDGNEESVMIQDDTDINPGFMVWLNEQKQRYDFISGPAGDQFYYMHLNVLRAVGFWDERYIGCYCGDADYFARVLQNYNTNRVSIQESHNWGLNHNVCGLSNFINTEMHVKAIDPNYSNQHWQMEALCDSTTNDNHVLKASQKHFQMKWNRELDNGMPIDQYMQRQIEEIDFYPWATRKLGIHYYESNRTPG